MIDTNKLHGEAPTQAIAIAAIVAISAVTGVLLLIGSASSLGNADASASPVATSAPDQIASPGEHSVFIREAHGRAAREGDAAPLPPTF